jgi:hypothetical protein
VKGLWQHERPLACPRNHKGMTWLGSTFWLCGPCKTVYVDNGPPQKETA